MKNVKILTKLNNDHSLSQDIIQQISDIHYTPKGSGYKKDFRV